MKRLYPLLLPIALSLYACSTNTASNTNIDGSKLYRIMAEGQISHEFEYNLNGTIAKQAFYGIPHRKLSEIIYFYGSDDKLIKTESYSDVSSSTAAQRLVYSYTDYKYNADGRVIEETVYTKLDSAFVFASKTIPTYDATGRVVSRLQLSIDNKPFNLFKYEYDSNGNVIVLESYQYNGTTPSLGSRSTYTHDRKNNPYLNLSVMPFSVNRNNIVKHTFANYNVTPGSPVVNTTETVYKSYNAAGFPVEVVEYGTSTVVYYYK